MDLLGILANKLRINEGSMQSSGKTGGCNNREILPAILNSFQQPPIETDPETPPATYPGNPGMATRY
jgi:hypothetical protein